MRRVLFAALVGLLSVMGPSWANAREPDLQINEFKKDGRYLEFELLTPGGPLLTSDDFSVTVNGIPADGLIALSGAGVERPAGAVLAVAPSSSLQGEPIAQAKKAARLFLTTVDPAARIALVTFSDEVRQLTDFTDPRSEALQAVRGLRAEGETALYDDLIDAVAIVDDRPPEQRNIVLLSDGDGVPDDTQSVSSLSDVVDAAASAGVKVFAVGLIPPGVSEVAVTRLAEKTGGEVFLTENAARLPSLFENLAQTLVSSYEISVVNPDPKASLVELDVEVFGEKAATGTRIFQLPVTDGEDPLIPPLGNVPIQVILLIVFLGAALTVFLSSETVREVRMSPADRILWYDEDGSESIDSDALINAAVLDRAKDLATRLADRAGLLQRMEREIEAAGMKWRPGEVIVASLLLGLSVGLLGLALRGPLAGLLLAVVAGVTPTLYIRINASRRRSAFVGQLSDVLMLIAGALRAGYSLQQALAAAGEDANPPASEEFRRAMAEIRLGATMDDALKDLARRIGVVDFDWTVMAIQVQREVGGDLAEILEVIAETIRERERIRGHIKALTAEGRLSGIILGAMPFVMAGFLLLRQPAYLEPLYTTGMGLFMIGGALFLMIVGGLWMRKIVKIEV
jgi:tight adherence protein B